MPDTWMTAHRRYSYPVNLSDYTGRELYPRHFKEIIDGSHRATILFEDRFRETCKDIEPWFEVIFWKLYSQKRISQQKTSGIIQQMLSAPSVRPAELLEKADRFMHSESQQDFDEFLKCFRFRTKVIATVATFPAFLDPNRFPMVDTRVAKWVNSHYLTHNAADPSGPQLIPSDFGRIHCSTVLTMADFSFYLHWIHWTRHMAKKLTIMTEVPWRARDVEMAVFTAWGNRGCSHPSIPLNPIGGMPESDARGRK